MDQSLLQIHTRERFEDFRRSGLRTATDFMDAYEAVGLPDENERLIWRGQLAGLLNSHRPEMVNNSHTLTLIETIRYALKRDPNLFQIRYWRDHEFEALPEDIEGERTKADLKLMQNLPDEAIAGYNKLINKFPKYHALLLYRGLAYASKGEYVKAIDDYNTVISNNRTNTDWETARQAYLYRGRAQLALGDLNEAAQNYSDAVEKFDSDFPEAQMDLAVVQVTHLGEQDATQYDKAIQNLTAVIASEFNVAEALANRGLARYYRAKAHQAMDRAAYQEELGRARKDLERALRLKPSLIPFYINLAIILDEGGELEAKEQVLTAALAQLEVSPDDSYAYRVRLERGYLFSKREQYHKAIADFEIATRLSPDQPTAFFYLGTALARLERHAEAQQAFQRATELDPTLLPGYEELANVQLTLQQYEAAEAAYINLLQLARKAADRAAEARAHLGLGRIYRHLEQWGDAERELNTAVNLTGDNQAEVYAQAVFELGMVALATEQNGDAVRHFTDSAVLFEVYGDARASANAYHYLGQAQIQEEQYDEAREALQTAQQRLNAVFVPGDADDRALQENIQQELAHLASLNGQTQPVSDG
jgi:tetratricopeptide (TPR) repeat protein